eukprot:3025279-Alexandrium_andersonii.AAC.1
MRQDRPGLTVLDDQDRQGRITAVLGEEAIVHCNLRRGMAPWDRAHVRGIGHTPANAVRAPRPEGHM